LSIKDALTPLRKGDRVKRDKALRRPIVPEACKQE
jgi:hypothetical protein